jgi:hypothetical protein
MDHKHLNVFAPCVGISPEYRAEYIQERFEIGFAQGESLLLHMAQKYAEDEHGGLRRSFSTVEDEFCQLLVVRQLAGHRSKNWDDGQES